MQNNVSLNDIYRVDSLGLKLIYYSFQSTYFLPLHVSERLAWSLRYYLQRREVIIEPSRKENTFMQ